MTMPSRRYALYVALAGVIMAPLLFPGYILTLDAVYAPNIPWPMSVSSDYPWQAFLHILNLIVPSQLIEKAIFVFIILTSAIGMHRLVILLSRDFRNFNWDWAPYFSGVLYAVNPFTYDRFMAGQYGVLMGYALLPFFIAATLAFLEKPTIKNSTTLMAISVLVAILSLPTIGECLLCALVILLTHKKDLFTGQHYRGLLIVVVGFLALSSYWIIPSMLGKGIIVGEIRQFTANDTAAFVTVGSNLFSKITNVLRLQGFWVEPHGLFTLPQAVFPGWGTIRLVIWTSVVYGGITCWRWNKKIAETYILLGVFATLLAAGVGSSILTHVGYREPQKFVGLVAVVFSIFIGFAVAKITTTDRQRLEEWRQIIPIVLFAALLIFTPTAYWGFANQLQPREYPRGWSVAKNYLDVHKGNYKVVFLPWHEYMSFGFTQRIIATPGQDFFGDNVIVSNNPELGAIKPPPGALATRVGDIVQTSRPVGEGRQLTTLNVRYVLLAKDYDYKQYLATLQTTDFQRVVDTPSISLFMVKD